MINLFDLCSFGITPMDGSLVVVIIIVMQWIKKQTRTRIQIPEWGTPLIPFVLGWVFSIPIVYAANDGAKAFMVMVAQVFWEGIKGAIVAMAAYKITHEIGKVGKRNMNKEEQEYGP